jgi:steroid delta-isomerase-like uncharacterized protein
MAGVKGNIIPGNLSGAYRTLILAIQCIAFTTFCTTSYGQDRDPELKANKEIVSTYINEIIDNRKLDLINNIFSPAYIFHEMDGKQKNNIADSSLLSFLHYLFNTIPDFRLTIDYIVAENDMVALNVTATGTQAKEFLGFPASNNRLVYKLMFFFRLSNKKIVEGWEVVDLDGLKKQLQSNKN